jgi:acyl-CoA synthetase (NDP forming)
VAGAEDVAAAIARAAASSEKPVLASVISAGGLPLTPGLTNFAYPESAARALGLAAGRAAWLRRPPGEVSPLEGVGAAAARDLIARVLADTDDTWLAAPDVRELLTAYGVPLVPECLAGTPEKAAEAARELGLPAVVKSAAPGAHKTETGGVALGLVSEDEVCEAAARIGLPVLVQPMVSGSAELLAGIVQDPVFGPLVAFGPGGVFAELIGQAEFRTAPLTDVDAHELVSAGKTGTLIRGFRGKPAADEDSLTDLLQRLSRIAQDLPEVAELDLNPVIARSDGCIAVDARIRVARSASSARTKTW